MEFRILGPLEVIEDGRTLDLGGQKQRALLAALLLEANRVVSSDRLIEALWEDDPPETAHKALHVYVSQLRKVIGRQRLQTRAPGYELRVEGGELDLMRFRQLQADRHYDEALSLWRGPPIAEFAYSRFAAAEIAHLEELRLACLEERIENELAHGRADNLGELEALVQAHPLREPLRGQFMLALYRSGRQADALEAYQEGRRVLVEEIGIEPGKALRDLHQAILRQEPELDWSPAGEPSVERLSRGALVGRERELAALVSGLDEVFAGRGRLFLLVGEPGIGKSRLAEELSGRARARGARVFVGRCWEAGGAPAYWPWVQSLRACVRETEPADLAEQLGTGAADVAQLLPELRERLPNVPEMTAAESEGARFRLFDAVASYLLRATRLTPLVLVLDDLHAADEPSLLLLQFLTRQLADSRLLVVGAYRDVDPSPTAALTGVLTELAREPGTATLPLTGLEQDEVARFIELTSGETPRETLVAAIHDETEGNPLFVGEIVRLLAAEGGLDESSPQLEIPQTVRDVIARRIGHLSDECSRVLVLASILGREFAVDALAQVSGVSEDELLETLDEAMVARVVSDVPGSRAHLRFAHVLIRDTLYEGLPSVRRVRMHRAALGALESLYGEDAGPYLAELAYHAIAGSEFDRGLGYARRAGDHALHHLAYEEAARQYETALDAQALAAPGDDSLRCELLLAVGESEVRAGNSFAAKQAFLHAADIAREHGFARRLAAAAAGYAGRVVWERPGPDDRLVAMLEEGLAVLPEADVELRVRLLSRLAGALRDERTRDRRSAVSAQAVELARRTGNPAALAYALDGRAAAILGPDVIAECFALGSELRDVAERIGDNEGVVHGHFHRILAALQLGDVPSAQRDLRAATRIAEELKQPAQLWLVAGVEAMLALALGRLDAAVVLIDEARAVGERAFPGVVLPIYWVQRYTLGDFRGELEDVAVPLAEVVGGHPARPVFRCALAHLQARLGRPAEARLVLDELRPDDFAAMPFDQEWLYGMSLLAETCALVGDLESAAILYELLLPWGDLNTADPGEGMRGSAWRYLGLLASTLGRPAAAETHFEAAMNANRRMGARPWLAHTQRDYALLLLGDGSLEKRDVARRLLAEAAATYEELGMATMPVTVRE